MRSPIEMMVDKACGFNVDESKKKDSDELKSMSEILLEVADSAKAWRLSKVDAKQDQLKIDETEEKLNIAIEKLIEIGW